MKRCFFRWGTVAAAVMLLSVSAMELTAEARVGGGRSIGSSGSRSYSRTSPSYSQPSQTRPSTAPSPTPQPQYQPQPPGGGFMRSLAGGLMGGFLGGMLFRGMAGAGGWGGAGGGIGLFEILLLAGIGYLVYRFVKGRGANNALEQSAPWETSSNAAAGFGAAPADLATGLSHIRQMDHGFDENRFKDQAMDIFFNIQGAWMNRNLSTVAGQLSDEMRGILQGDLEQMLREKRTNRLENIAVRSVDIVEAWQENGQDFITAHMYANLLDYTVDDTTGAVISGSKSEPVKFEEYWTFTRPVGSNPWRLSAIAQV